MGNARHLEVRGPGTVLQLSMRRMANLVAFAQQYEFEDVVAQVTGADRIEPSNLALLELSRRAYKAVRLTTGSRALARRLVPRPASFALDRDYALFLPVFNNPFELYALTLVPDWRARCRYAACVINEIWLPDLPEYLLELLSEFDQIFLGVRHPVEEVARLTGRPCSYLPLAADVLTFAPPEPAPPRTIDVCNIGRRSVVTHDALVSLARARAIFYYHDTIRGSGKQRTFSVANPSEHRLLYANLLQRSRYFIANKARVNEPETTAGHEEISGRYYEGLAAGTVMLGVAPKSEAFAQQFDWPGAALAMPFDCPNVAEVLMALEARPEVVQRISRDNLRQAALRHDWLYRLEEIYRTLDLPFTPGMRARERQLHYIAERAMQSAA